MALSTLIRGSDQTADFEGATYKRRSDFVLGATLSANDEILLWPTDQGGDGFYYQWLGAFPKNVPAGSTPASSGGIGSTTWAIVPATPRVIVAATIADLRKVDPRKSTTVQTLGYYVIGDQGQGLYRFDSTDTASADDGGTVIVGLANSRWKLVYDDRISVRQFGAKGDFNRISGTGTNDGAALQRCHDNTPRGVKVFYPLGLYYTTTTIFMNGGSNVEFQSRATTTNEAYCAIVGATALDGVVHCRLGDTTFSGQYLNMVVTRTGSNWPATARGLICSGVDQQVFQDCASYAHGIAVHVNGQLNPTFERLNTWNCNGYHVKISNCVEPRFLNCRFGRNGGADQVSDSYILIDGSGGISVDTVDFTSCQFNQSGQLTNSVIRVINYNNPNGIFTFTGCHMEGWKTYILNIDATTARLQRMKFVGCTGTSDIAAQFMGGNVSVVEDFQITGCTLAVTMTFDQVVSASMNSSHLAGPLVINRGQTIIMGNRITGSVTLTGVAGDKLVLIGNVLASNPNDNFVGTRAVMGNVV